MRDHGSNDPSSPGDATGFWAPADAAVVAGKSDPPTIRTGATEGSSPRRAAVAEMPRPGDRLESFELDRPIGVGGMGAVFLATDTRLHREVALKVLPPEQSGDSEVVQRFYQEGRAAARLDHENIARVFTIGTDKGHHFIAFEYIEGPTLRQKVQENGPLPVDEAINYTLQIAGALVHAAERGVVHRDIKPSNIIVTPQGRAKLVDMGLARRFERGGDDGLTQSGMTLGTFDYISPEQARDPRDVDVRGDLYSLGCTLFHMLTGRPPFPEGTVLQKLLQHQEEPPPDIRALNSAVPPDLGAILTKLMAKDRDRRYQTPELLVRDLLTVAGAMGLRSLSPEGLVWMSPRTAPSWEKHLVWGVPAAALAAVVGLLAWWGQPTEPAPATVDGSLGAGSLVRPVASKGGAGPESSPVRAAVKGSDSLALPPPGSGPLVSPRAVPRELVVRTGEELAAALANEATGSTLILGDDGPYVLRASAAPATARRDLAIKAAADVRPILRPARSSAQVADGSDPALLTFGPGEIRIEGVEFQGEAGGPEGPWTAIRGDGTSLTLVRCTFRAPSELGLNARAAALRLRAGTATAGDAEPSARLRADACHFDGGQMAVRAKGRVNLALRDCTFGPGEPSFRFDNAGSASPVAAELALSHASIRVGTAPVIQAAGTDLLVEIDRSIVAAPGDRVGTLAEIDDPDRLEWRGKGNLYAGIGVYLQPSAGGEGRSPIRGFDAWADDPRDFREIDSIPRETAVWKIGEPGRSSARSDVSAGFAPLPGSVPAVDPGARRGPFGPIAREASPASASSKSALALNSPTASRGRDGSGEPAASPGRTAASTETKGIAIATIGPVPSPPTPPGPMPTPVENEDALPLAPMGRDVEDAPPSVLPRPPIAGARPAAEVAADRDVKAEAAAVNSAEALAEAIARLGDRGGVIRLAPDADLRLATLEFRGSGRIVLEAEPTPTPTAALARPRLRFRPAPPGSGRTAERPAFVRVRSGSLELQRLDVILEASQAPDGGEWEAFALSPGADLTLTGCTVTVEGQGPSRGRASLVRVAAGDGPVADALPRGEFAPAQFRATDSLLRSAGDLADVDGGYPLDLELTNAIIGTRGSLLHGHGLTPGASPEGLSLELRQVTARVAGGLVYLESSPGDPELPVVDVTARNAILTTGDRSAPLIRLDGQEEIEALRDRLRWDGNGVVYHRIDVYRRDQTAQTGTPPQTFDRSSWRVAVGLHERMPTHDDAMFRAEWPAGKSPATIDRDDVRLDLEAPAPAAGPDWRRIPPAPPR